MKSCPYARALLFSRALVIGIVLGFFAFRACSEDPVHAQAPRWRPAPISDEVALARVCLSEDGWHGAPQECAAHSASATNRAAPHGMRWRQALETYSRKTFNPNRSGHRAWLSQLMPDGVQPAAWPAGQGWPRRLWLAKVESARRVLAGEIAHDCEHPPEHWGGMRNPSDRERAERAVAAGRWIPSNCYRLSPDGDRMPTANTFFSVRRAAR